MDTLSPGMAASSPMSQAWAATRSAESARRVNHDDSVATVDSMALPSTAADSGAMRPSTGRASPSPRCVSWAGAVKRAGVQARGSTSIRP